MTDKYNLGAINTETKQYTLASHAIKTEKYNCIDCKQSVILKKGSIRKPHFAHHNPSAIQKCTYYEHPSEGQLHKDAKYKLADRLNKKLQIIINNQCPKCTAHPAVLTDYEIEYRDGDNVVVEYRDPNGKYVADIAILNNNNIRYIFEIKHTHATLTTVRPEPWFEIDVADIFLREDIVQNPDHPEYCHGNYLINCVRTSRNRFCPNCRIELEPWVENIPRLNKRNGADNNWAQDKPCLQCKRIQYSPVWVKGPRQICKICLANYEDILKEKYNKTSACMIMTV